MTRVILVMPGVCVSLSCDSLWPRGKRMRRYAGTRQKNLPSPRAANLTAPPTHLIDIAITSRAAAIADHDAILARRLP